MQCTVQITCDGGVVACLDTDDFADDEDSQKLLNLRADDLLDQCARVAIEAFLKLHPQPTVEADDGDDGE